MDAVGNHGASGLVVETAVMLVRRRFTGPSVLAEVAAGQKVLVHARHRQEFGILSSVVSAVLEGAGFSYGESRQVRLIAGDGFDVSASDSRCLEFEEAFLLSPPRAAVWCELIGSPVGSPMPRCGYCCSGSPLSKLGKLDIVR